MTTGMSSTFRKLTNCMMSTCGHYRTKGMIMAKKKFRDLAAETMSPESRARAQLKARVMLEELRLGELRRARQLSQEELAERLDTTQSEVSKLERRADVYVSTL